MTTRAELEALLARRRAAMDRAFGHITDPLTKAWVETWSDIDRELARLHLAGLSHGGRATQLRRASARAVEAIQELARLTAAGVTGNARQIAEQAVKDQLATIGAQLQGTHITALRAPGHEVSLLVERTTQQITSTAWALSADMTESMHRALRLGISGSVGPAEAAQRMLAAVGGVFTGGMARALTIARTELIDAHRQAAAITHAANADVLEGWVWYAHLRQDTCPACVAMHGSQHPLQTPGPLGHPNCRCARVPVVTGFPMTVETGPDWFARQTPTTQRSVLGPTRFDAWTAGRYQPADWARLVPNHDWRPSYQTTPVP